MEVFYKSTNTILHGSPYQNLSKVNPTNARYKGKVFGTYNFQRALRYIASLENGGDSVLSKNNKLFVLNTNPINLVKEKGSVYLVPSKTFEPDTHKGDKYDWIYSSTQELEVLAEFQHNSVLEVWNTYGIFAVAKEMTENVLSNSNDDALRDCIDINKQLLATKK